jgi:hypothetical protein
VAVRNGDVTNMAVTNGVMRNEAVANGAIRDGASDKTATSNQVVSLVSDKVRPCQA